MYNLTTQHNNMSRTLVIILSETRAHELTFDNFKQNVLDVLNADLCVCIGIKDNYDYENRYYKFNFFILKSLTNIDANKYHHSRFNNNSA